MANVFISGLINTETTVKVREFPIPYYPIDYPFFGVQTQVSGVAYNIARALQTLGIPLPAGLALPAGDPGTGPGRTGGADVCQSRGPVL